MNFVPTTESDYITATSYLSISDADEIINAQRNSEEWSTLDEDVKKIFLNQSSLAVDGVYSYQGLQTDESQFLKFPRDCLLVIPASLKFATALLALEYVRDDTTRGDVLSEKIGKLAWTFGSRQHGENGMTQEILSFLKPLKATTVKFTII